MQTQTVGFVFSGAIMPPIAVGFVLEILDLDPEDIPFEP
jgi:hypothetical protein